MKAVTWCGKRDVRVENVADPKILNPRDAIIRVTSTAICGSDLHLFDGYIPRMESGDILGHEFMGEIVETGPGVKNLNKGDRVVIPFNIACGGCFHCTRDEYSLCDNSNRNWKAAEAIYGFSPAGLFGYSHLLGGYAGGQAEYVRVPFADVGCKKIPEGLTDEQVLFLTDIFPTGFQAVDNADMKGGECVAVWGCGPVGQFAIRSAFMLGAEKVFAIDDVEGRLKMAADAGATPIDMSDEYIYDKLKQYTGGRGPDVCIDAVGLEAHGLTVDAALDRAKAALYLATDRAHALRQAINCCAKGGTVSLPGVYGGVVDKMPMGAAFGKGLTFKMGQTHVHRYLDRLLKYIQDGQIDPTFVITHRLKLSEAPHGYQTFADNKDECIKVVLTP